MSVSPEVLTDHLDYTAWASARLLSAAATLPSTDLNRDFGTADKTILGTLVHIFAADRIWLARLTGAPTPNFSTDADRSLAVLEQAWPALHEGWKAWASELTPERINALVTYKDLKGNQWTEPLWQPILHVVNHGSHHRGQISGFLRSLGHRPPPLDLIFYYRQRAGS